MVGSKKESMQVKAGPESINQNSQPTNAMMAYGKCECQKWFPSCLEELAGAGAARRASYIPTPNNEKTSQLLDAA